jgi:hypothetical protein
MSEVAIVWVTKERYAELSGLTEGQIRARIDSRKWVRGVHYTVDGKATMINVEKVQQWWTSLGECEPIELADESRSDTRSAVVRIPRRSSSTPIRKLI